MAREQARGTHKHVASLEERGHLEGLPAGGGPADCSS